jgi:hypothetical protein
LNVGTQTSEQMFSADYVNNLEKQIIELKQKLEKSKKEFIVRKYFYYLGI